MTRWSRWRDKAVVAVAAAAVAAMAVATVVATSSDSICERRRQSTFTIKEEVPYITYIITCARRRKRDPGHSQGRSACKND